MNILFRNMTLVVVEVDLKRVSGGRKISQRLGCGPQEIGRRPSCSHRAGKRSWTEVPERVSLGSLLGLFIDPILSTNLWSDAVG